MKKTHSRTTLITGLLALPALALTACGGQADGGDAESFPDETITFITAFAAGGANDSLARMLAEHTETVAEDYDFVIENIDGGSGSVGQAEGAQADPDGHTLLLVTPSIITNPMFNNVPYTHESFEPVILINSEPHVLLVNADAPFDDFASFVEHAEENPGRVSIGVSGAETTTAFTSRDLATAAGIETTTVPHDGTADALLQAQGGHIDGAVAGGLTEAQSAIDEGSLKPILVFDDERLEGLPDVPTASEEGLDTMHSSWRGVAAPEGTDPEVIEALHNVFQEALETPGYEEAAQNLNLSIDYAGPEEFQELIDATYETYSAYED
ncbi:tripartite tricarboxylate transporter substrate binding protein [Nesterenkonia sp. K-15-9-6]|uniref:tripartite tricarboxylate transporter substrate binding protein n=1 Tax=Nesterenkonia sp. K-15-9-6 TaxID=3093918 RepID=UPI0040443474